MKSIVSLLIGSFFLVACASKGPKILSSSTSYTERSVDFVPFFDVEKYSQIEGYGLLPEFPIMVGGIAEGEGAINQRRYIASLAGPKGEVLFFERKGSCCPYVSENGFDGAGLLDVYEVWYSGLKKPIVLYLSLYDYEPLHIPKGFTKR